MDPTLSPQIMAVLKVLEQKMGAGAAPSALTSGPASFNERFQTFEGNPATVLPHEIEYGMSQGSYDKKIVDDLFANASQQPKMPDFPGMNEFIQPGQQDDQDMSDMMDMFMGG